MSGFGPPPKDPSKLVGHGAAKARAAGMRVITASPVAQPDLPEFDVQVEVGGELVSQEFVWPARTREWWAMWGESPLSAEFTSTDWSELLDTAMLHARFWRGEVKLAPELRLRAAKFGATPEDRARLRIQFAEAEEREAKPQRRASAAESRHRGLRLAE